MQQHSSSDQNSQKVNKVSPLAFDFERLIPRIINHWPLFILSVGFALGVAFYLNSWYFKNIYKTSATFRIGSGINNSNTMSASNSINFIWGGSNNRVQTLSYVMSSRTHNDFVVKETEGYVYYYEEGKLKKKDSYKTDAPFNVVVDTVHTQIINQEIAVEPINEFSFRLKQTSTSGTGRVYNYEQDSLYSKNINIELPVEARYGQWISGKNFRFKIIRTKIPYYEGSNYTFKLVTLNEAIQRTSSNISIVPVQTGANIVSVSKTATNLNEAVDIINTSLKVLIKNEMAEKNLATIKTKEYLQSQLDKVKVKLDSASQNLTDLQKRERIYDFESKKGEVISAVTSLERERVMQIDRINALNSLIPKSNSSVNNMIALNIAGLDVQYYMNYVAEIESLENRKKEMLLTYQPQSEEIQLLNQQIAEARRSIDNVVSAQRRKLNSDLKDIERKLSDYESQAQFLPQQEFSFLEANRGFAINDEMYNSLMTQLSIADMQIASNVSDILIVDNAQNLSQGPIAPDRKQNYIIALVIGLAAPLLYIVLRELFDTKVKVIKDITSRTKIPLIGIIGNLGEMNPLIVIDRPKSGIAESFRAVRSNLKFLYKKTAVHPNNKTILVTSFIGGEGKTFVSMNLASVLGAGDKKAVLLGLDLRKPKIFDDFKLNNHIGVTNYLVDEARLQEIIQPTKLPNLDIITAGPIPPNPSELILSTKMDELINQLKERYDYVVLDTPPIGLVSDSYDLLKYADATLFISRYNYSERNFLNAVQSKYEDGELNNIGIILNDFQVKMGYGYGYGNEYGYGMTYGYGYFEEDEFFEDNFIGRIKRFFRNFKRH
ncbi:MULTISPECIES: exopolysaccharide transport family protein [Weeksella]|uniref:non-specific protein-tyrosine kinase n=1 Tax=Weeksella virosa (strain ATCC 43766 / DSM 16922 / JCM 21250 / CCUG 30538 / CDC 9751 / IAM 14551 / NBRC 16016 / NCTC 11634 / CL345/78) TaxID=865938 RepID=F0NZQ4_WEEVC|nr:MULTISPECIES: tyrosine-protein kinase family protein [Weeksella]ADX67313.1 capsular exopolysaccharide family [Weeksella virosa DSM 16922]MDK7374458.1 polysaccharide biosynthesis tyrosine autokinase [Weeksella virosa]OFM81846.1 capsular biosynthesis protein [Weeksella sp. HMSC059D05]SUP53595.1 Tyrosine-protein kinase ptk [Weeksella virosa]VEH62951.1 Tyrosine-protein kinase ptk [Weeksella virosa]